MKLRTIILVAGIISSLFGARAAAGDYQLADAYSALRKMIFETKPSDIGVRLPSEGPGVWGVLMETGYPTAVVTLVSLADGTVSLYFSNGGGIIGLGPHPGPHKASEVLLQAAPAYLQAMQQTSSFPLPQKGETRFYVFTRNGTFTTNANEEEYGKGRSPLSPLFFMAQDLITQIRLVNEKQGVQGAPGKRQ